MKTCCVTASVSRKAGGLFQSVRYLHLELSRFAGVGVEVVALEDEFTAEDLPQWHPLSVQTLPVRGPRSFGYSSGFKPALDKGQYDLLHVHGIWMYPSCAALCWHRNTGMPHIISPRGMLDHWALRNSRWKKRLAGWLYENAHLREAACLHALCESEARAMRAFGLKNPICIIPNGIDLPSLVESSELRVESSIFDRFAQGRKVLLYLGRIHPKKGLVNLLRAWKQTLNPQPSTLNSWVLAIAGWDQGGHEAELKRLCDEMGIAWLDIREHRTSNVQHPTSNIWTPDARPPTSIVFLGPQFGEDKAACYRNCDAFILPSFSEGLPMVVLEAWAYGKPVLMTPECNLPEGFAANAALRIEPSVESIVQGLQELFRTPHSTLRNLGDNGRALVAEKFAWPKIASEMKAVYDWVLGGGPKPGCVQLKG
jgi:poly(glycerol-phosphate) alpha-glucosyltransferase